VYDALTHRRVYHEALPEDKAMDIMEEGRGKHFDPFLLGVFLSILPEIRRIAQQNPDDRAAGYIRAKTGAVVLPCPEIPLAAAGATQYLDFPWTAAFQANPATALRVPSSE